MTPEHRLCNPSRAFLGFLVSRERHVRFPLTLGHPKWVPESVLR